MCAQKCWNKANYDTLLKNAVIHAEQMINIRTHTYKYMVEFLNYKLMYENHRKTLSEIQSRKFIELEDL